MLDTVKISLVVLTYALSLTHTLPCIQASPHIHALSRIQASPHTHALSLIHA